MTDLRFYALSVAIAAAILTLAGAAHARPIGTRAVASGNINRPVVGNRVGNTNVVRNNNVNIDVDRGWDYGHPVARGAAFGVAAATTAAVTRAVIGSTVYALPPACSPYAYSGYSYYSCGGAWYEPRYQGDSVVYVVVNQPPH